MKLIIHLIVLGLWATWPLFGAAQTSAEQNLWREAQVAMFDESWDDALDLLRQFQRRFPGSNRGPEAVFWEAQALQHLGEKLAAVERFGEFLKISQGPEGLRTQAQLARIELDVDLYQSGDDDQLEIAIQALQDSQPEVRHFAALQLSYVKNDRIRSKAIPVLQSILRNQGDAELRNQAAVALLRIDPDLLADSPVKESTDTRVSAVLRVSVVENGEVTLKVSLPLSLARMAIEALPESALGDLRKEGINPQNILEELEKSGGLVEVESEGSRIRLWIERN